jgi:hypothetical protein
MSAIQIVYTNPYKQSLYIGYIVKVIRNIVSKDDEEHIIYSIPLSDNQSYSYMELHKTTCSHI